MLVLVYRILSLFYCMMVVFPRTFTIDGTRRLGDRIKIWQMGNFFNSKKLGGKISIFSIFLENDREFWRSVCAVLRTSGALRNGWKKFRDFFETFPPEGAKCFYRGLFKSSLIFY